MAGESTVMVPDSDEWEKIKHWVGTNDERTAKDPVAAALRMADGGEVPEIMAPEDPIASFDVSGGDSETVKGRGAPATVTPPSAPPPPPPMAEAPEPETPAAPAAPMVPAAAPSAPAVPANFEAQADKILGSSPEARRALFQHLQKSDMWAQIPALIAGFGDSIARGYGHDAGANHMGELENKLTEQDKSVLENEKDMADAGKERYGLTQQLQARDATSPYSRMVQNAYRGMFKSMGASDAEINSLPGELASDVAGKRVTLAEALEKIRLENTWHQGDLAVRQQAERNNAAGHRTEAAKATLAGSKVPFVGPSHAEKQAAAKELAAQATGATTVPATGPLGPETVRGGKTYEWSSVTGKYHLKK